jgi:integrase
MPQPTNLLKRGETWFFRATIRGKQVWKTLETGDKKLATIRAKKLRAELLGENWDVLLQVGRPTSFATLGEVFTAYRAFTAGRDITARTVRENITCLGRILRGVHGKTYSVESARANVLTAELKRDYQAKMIETAKPAGPVAIDRAKTTSFSTAQQASSLFSKDCLQSAPYRELKLPDLSGFLEQRLERGAQRGFQDPGQELIAKTIQAMIELKKDHPGHWIALVLAGNLGLRRKEAIWAKWDWVRANSYPDPENAGTMLQGYEMDVIKRADFDPKGSERRISIHPEVWTGLLELRTSFEYIMPGQTYSDRMQIFKDNAGWLRGLGWQADKPNHALRKLFGSEMATKHGLYAAQSALGHSDPRLTSQIYATFLDRGKVVKIF